MNRPLNLAPGQERSITVTLRSLRNPPLDIKLTSQPLNTAILDIKNTVSGQTRIPLDKIKILHNKRPVQDSKVLKEIIGETDMLVDFSIMVIGGAAAILPEKAPEVSTNNPAQSVLGPESEVFWTDLTGFLTQRLKDQAQGEELSKLFKSTWNASHSES